MEGKKGTGKKIGTGKIVETKVTSDGFLLGRKKGDIGFNEFLGLPISSPELTGKSNCNECPKNNTKECWIEKTGELRDVCPEFEKILERKEMLSKKFPGGKKQMASLCWCPDCGDSLEIKTIWRVDKKYGRIVDHHEYYCFGCDKTFLLQAKK